MKKTKNGKKRFLKGISMLLAAVMTLTGFSAPVFAENMPDAAADVCVSLGEDLDAQQRAAVLDLLGLTEESLSQYRVIYVTNEEEHTYLDPYIDPAKIGDTALSSSKIVLREEGHGIQVTTYNINYCTVGMYQNALATAGVRNADVYVAAPAKISGTAALIGVMKSYSETSGESLSEENVQTAVEELAVTSDLGESTQNQEGIEELMTRLKEELDKIDFSDTEQVDEEINDVADQVGVQLTEEEVAEVRELLKKLKDLNLDFNALGEQLQSLYEKFSLGDSGGIAGVFQKIGDFFVNVFTTIADWFTGLFGGNGE